MLGWLSTAKNLITSTGKFGLGAGVALGGVAAAKYAGGGLEGAISDPVDGAARISGGASPEATWASVYKTLQKLGEFILKLTGGDYGQWLADFGKDGVEGKTAEEKKNELSPLDPGRQDQRIYENPNDPTSRYTIAGPNGTPPSVEFSSEPETWTNSVSLGLKGVKDGLGVATGAVAGSIGWVADTVGIDYLLGFKGEDWGSSWYNNTAGAVNGFTDFVSYDVLAKGVTMPFDVVANKLSGMSLTESFSSAWNKDYEPTVRSEADLSIYNVTSKVSGAAVGTIGLGFAGAAMGLGGASVVTGGSMMSNTFGTVASGLRGVGSMAGSGFKHASSFAGISGNKPAPTP